MVRLCTVLLLLSLTLFALLEFSDAARGRGGGSTSSGSRSSGSRSGGGRSGGGRSRSGSSSRSYSRFSGSSSKPKVTKYTPIKATTSRSPVIVGQTKLGSRSNTLTKAVVGYVVLRYAFATAPVYRRGYPMYRSYVTIPEERAIRVTYEEEKLLNANGSLCLGNLTQKHTLREGIGEEDLVELNTTVKYKETGLTKTYHGNTISLEDIKEQEFEVTTRARYNTTIINGTSCTQVEKIVQGTMITMYETNPNTASTAHINNKLIATIIALFAVIHALAGS